MFKIVWSKEKYEDEYKIYAQTFGEAPQSSMASFMSWHVKTRKKFNQHLMENNIGWEDAINDDYKALRDCEVIRCFFETNPTFLTLGDFHNLARKAIDQTFGDLRYLDNGYPKLRGGALKGKTKVLLQIFKNYGIKIDDY